MFLIAVICEGFRTAIPFWVFDEVKISRTSPRAVPAKLDQHSKLCAFSKLRRLNERRGKKKR